MNHNMPECPVEIAMNFLKDRIGVLIIGYLLQEPMNTVQLQRKIGSISLQILKKRMKDMEEWRIVECEDKIISETSIFKITEFGKSFDLILKEMECWGAKHRIQKNSNGI